MYIRKGLKLSDEEIKDLSDAWRKVEEWAEIEYKKRSQVRLLKGHLRHKLNNRSTRIASIKGCYKNKNRFCRLQQDISEKRSRKKINRKRKAVEKAYHLYAPQIISRRIHFYRKADEIWLYNIPC